MDQRTSPLLTFVVDQELLDRLADFRSEHRIQSPDAGVPITSGIGTGLWCVPGRERLTPLFAFAFGGCKGAKAPCRKGVLAAANAPLSLAGPCRGKRRKANHGKEPADFKENASCAAKK